MAGVVTGRLEGVDCEAELPLALDWLADRYRGALVGLAVGDALGATVEFKPRGSFIIPTELSGGGPFNLKPGEWTDDTSQALCLAESLLVCGGFDAADAMGRLARWYSRGHLSVNGRCFDVGPSTSASLDAFIRTGKPYQGTADRNTNGVLMRLAPVAMAYAADSLTASRACKAQARLTHGGAEAIACADLLGFLLAEVLGGVSLRRLLKPGPVLRIRCHTAPPSVRAVVEGSFRTKPLAAVRAGYSAVACLEAALWCCWHTAGFEDAVTAAAAMGDDSDTVGAVVGQLAGAAYGWSSIPSRWRDAVAWGKTLALTSDALFGLAGRLTHADFPRGPAVGPVAIAT